VVGPIFGDGIKPRRAPIAHHLRPVDASNADAPVEPDPSGGKGVGEGEARFAVPSIRANG
jgi:hypothetical protein